MTTSKKGGGKNKPQPESEIDVEKLLRGLKFIHPDEATLAEYRDGGMEELGVAIVEAHLKLCHICERRLKFLREEKEAHESYEITEEDLEANRRFVETLSKKKK